MRSSARNLIFCWSSKTTSKTATENLPASLPVSPAPTRFTSHSASSASPYRVRRKFIGLAYYLDKLTGAVLGMIGLTIVKSAIAK
ncbi:MAG: hypothetical protein LBB65_04095 [Burkholderiales bacterium]|nr:hypothetical protein [Burkholderiales bacterium]